MLIRKAPANFCRPLEAVQTPSTHSPYLDTPDYPTYNELAEYLRRPA